MKKAYLGLGTNLGDRENNLKAAIKRINESAGNVISVSSVYESDPWGFKSRNKFLNMVLALETGLLPPDLLEEIMKIETELGRVRKGRGYSSRVIDIDILLYDNTVIESDDLKVPHPLLHRRKFVLFPLCELAPDIIHPVLNKSMRFLLEQCEDGGEVKKIKDL